MTDPMLLYACLLVLLVLVGGLLLIAYKALTVAHDLAKIALQGGVVGQPAPTAAPSILPKLSSILSKSPPTPTTSAPSTSGDVVDEGLVKYVKSKEGLALKAYWDYKQYSIGYGTKATGPTEVITEPEAEARLRSEIAKAYALVTAKFPNLPKGQAQALTDLTYNAGSGWEQQSLGAAVAAQKIETIKADILLYNHAGGVVNEGLTQRRKDEVSWFDNPL